MLKQEDKLLLVVLVTKKEVKLKKPLPCERFFFGNYIFKAMKLLFIIGMQKSGTSLLNRMLMQQKTICNPFLPEGKYFWGDVPPFSPTEKPCGEIFQKHKEKKGHSLDRFDYVNKDKKLLCQRIKDAKVTTPILMNKNPYNTVRIPWLKKVFPDSKVVAMYRNPVANVYSLLKRYSTKNQKGVMPENGWWGIKPQDWLKIQSNNKVLQCSRQWSSVNNEILRNRNQINLIINYDNLCENPEKEMENIFQVMEESHDFHYSSKLKNFNTEYLRGSRLLSKNKELKKNKEFDLSMLNETIEFPALTSSEIKQITDITKSTWKSLQGF